MPTLGFLQSLSASVHSSRGREKGLVKDSASGSQPTLSLWMVLVGITILGAAALATLYELHPRNDGHDSPGTFPAASRRSSSAFVSPLSCSGLYEILDGPACSTRSRIAPIADLNGHRARLSPNFSNSIWYD